MWVKLESPEMVKEIYRRAAWVKNDGIKTLYYTPREAFRRCKTLENNCRIARQLAKS